MHAVQHLRSKTAMGEDGGRKVWRSVAGALVLILVGASAFLWVHWPFSRGQVLKQLQEASQSKVQFANFHGTYFPRPGCVLEKVTFRLASSQETAPFITVERLRIEGTFFGLFTKHVRLIKSEGMHILVPPKAAGEGFQTPQRSSIVIDDLIADGGVLEFESHNPEEAPLKFSFRRFKLKAIGSSKPASFQADFLNPEPPGEIVTNGKFGPWNAEVVGKTPVSGQYSFERANLEVFGGIAGMLSSSGQFKGILKHIAVQGNTYVPDFTVTSSEHPVPLRTDFQAVVDATTGDTFLQIVTAKFGKTTVSSRGSVAAAAGEEGKTALIDFSAREGKIEDLLRLFATAERPPMMGTVSFLVKATLPPGRDPFLQKVQLVGDFGIDGGTFAKTTQEAVKDLSRGAQGLKDHVETDPVLEDPRNVLTDLKGHVVLRNGIARFSNLSFNIPGAAARLYGTYNLASEKIDLHGTLTTDSKLSHTVHGAKALILKVLDPLFKKQSQDGYAAPVKVTGTYRHPSFGIDLGTRSERRRAKGTGGS
jgi:hypothetical protein